MAQISSSSSSHEEEPAPELPPAANAAQADAVDALLDEIDGTLQQNAEQFVRSFVQKGGQ